MTIDVKLIDQLLTDYKKPEDIIGENGLLKQLTKGGWPSLPPAQPHRGCPILRVFFAKGGRRTDCTIGFAFHHP
jgi:hypothetical protein